MRCTAPRLRGSSLVLPSAAESLASASAGTALRNLAIPALGWSPSRCGRGEATTEPALIRRLRLRGSRASSPCIDVQAEGICRRRALASLLPPTRRSRSPLLPHPPATAACLRAAPYRPAVSRLKQPRQLLGGERHRGNRVLEGKDGVQIAVG